jgi:hypothetical protein
MKTNPDESSMNPRPVVSEQEADMLTSESRRLERADMLTR